MNPWYKGHSGHAENPESERKVFLNGGQEDIFLSTSQKKNQNQIFKSDFVLISSVVISRRKLINLFPLFAQN